MRVQGRPDTKAIWRVALLTGLITSTFSTLTTVFNSGRIGRDPGLSWMEVGTIALRDSGVQEVFGLREIAAGIVVHQLADIGWVLVFYAILSRWTLHIRPLPLLAIAPVWAGLTQAMEYYVILPWLQPLRIMQTPYWVGYLVHLASASAYPIFLWLREPLLGVKTGDATFARRWTFGLGALLSAMMVLAAFSDSVHELPWPLATEQGHQYNQSFLRRMTAHHEVGVSMAKLAANKSTKEELRVLGRLMVADQRAEIDHMNR